MTPRAYQFVKSAAHLRRAKSFELRGTRTRNPGVVPSRRRRERLCDWAAIDIDGIVALLADDALLTMPPEAQRFEGSAQIGTFFATAPLDGHLDRIQLVPTRANSQPALAAYADEQGEGVFDANGVMVFAIRGDRIMDHGIRSPTGAVRPPRPPDPASPTANREG